jgi:SAM-dependent methyltransferase
MSIKRHLVKQAGNPRGIVGHAEGWLFAYRPSNRRRNRWAVDLLDVRAGDRVLEVGFGPGRAIAELARRSEHVYGLDRSAVMLRQASRRNEAAIRSGRVTLCAGAVEAQPFAGPFDVILAVNSLGFWSHPGERLAQLRGTLAPGGRIALVSQPRTPGATRATSLEAAVRLTALLEGAGLARTTSELLELDPPAVCVIGIDDAAADRRQPSPTRNAAA